MVFNQPSSRIFKSLDKGQEKHVYSHSREGREGKTVIKAHQDSDTPNRPFTQKEKDGLEETYNRLRMQYGDIVVPQKFLEQKDGYLLVQKKIETHSISDVFQHSTKQIPDKVRPQLKDLVAKLKKGFQEYEQRGKTLADNIPLDLFGENNLVITKDINLAYLDVGMPISQKFEDWEESWVMIYKGLILYLEYLSGEQPDMLVQEDNFYHDYFDYFNTQEKRYSKPWTHWKDNKQFLDKIFSA